MQLFTITLMNPPAGLPEKLKKSMEQAFTHLHIGAPLELDLEEFSDCAHIVTRGILPEFQLNGSMDELYRAAAECIAEYVLLDREDELIERLIRTEYGYEGREDMQSILQYCRQMLHGAADVAESGRTTMARRKTKLVGLLHRYLQEQTELNVQGFIRFRLQDYMEELREVVEYAIDEFLMDKQYQEFISLLKYFVYIQEAKIPVAHLIHKGGNEFTLLGEDLQPIDTSDFDTTLTVEMIEKDISFEDMIVSTLITVSPEQIFIHTREPEVQVISTILQIFEKRAEVCTSCTLCKSALGEAKAAAPAFQLGEHS